MKKNATDIGIGRERGVAAQILTDDPDLLRKIVDRPQNVGTDILLALPAGDTPDAVEGPTRYLQSCSVIGRTLTSQMFPTTSWS